MYVATGFTEASTHPRSGAPCADRIGLTNVILAEGTNFSLRKMADATNSHTFWELIRIGRWHVEGDAKWQRHGLVFNISAPRSGSLRQWLA